MHAIYAFASRMVFTLVSLCVRACVCVCRTDSTAAGINGGTLIMMLRESRSQRTHRRLEIVWSEPDMYGAGLPSSSASLMLSAFVLVILIYLFVYSSRTHTQTHISVLLFSIPIYAMCIKCAHQLMAMVGSFSFVFVVVVVAVAS